MELNIIRENKTQSILQFAIPSTISMILSALITITDGYFTGNYIGSDGLAAINLGLPLTYLFLAVGLMVGVGGSVLSGICLGEKNTEKANGIFRQTIFMSLMSSAVLSGIVYLLFNPILSVLGAKGQVADFFKDYYYIELIGLPLLVLNTVAGMFIRTDGKPQFYLLLSITSVALNGILDAVFVKLGFGIKGIALSSAGTLAFELFLAFIYFRFMASYLKIGKFIYDKEAAKKITMNGSSEFIGEMASCISMFSYNHVLMKYSGPDGVAAFSILGYSVFIFGMIALGFGQGMIPLVSYCCGAKDFELCKDLRKITSRTISAVGILFAIVLFFAGTNLSSIFVESERVLELASTGSKMLAPQFLIMGFNIICSMYFTAMGKAKESAMISGARGLVILLATIYIFPVFWGINGIWLTSPVTEALTLLLALRILRKK